ncbi:MAG: NUDIX hydrolase [Pseudomonadales bacterium]|nr:NUDIX hydrolase [Pseudomonadales bacterium]
MPENHPGDRRALLQQLDAYQRRYPAEWVMAARMRDFVYHHERCFQRDLWVGHVTGSAWLLDRSGEQVLLTHHRKLDKWLQLGGHADGESEIAKVALKEAREESGITGIELLSSDIFDLDIHLIPARNGEPSHYHYDCRFLLQCTDSEDFTVSDESHDLMWIPLDELDTRTREISMQRMATKTPRSLTLCS